MGFEVLGEERVDEGVGEFVFGRGGFVGVVGGFVRGKVVGLVWI